jgi:hydroxymethylbilane synthase
MEQTSWVINELSRLNPEMEFVVRKIKTKGDVMRDVALAKIGGKGLFVKEIEEALLQGEIDLATHSLKDLPTELPMGLLIGAVTKRADPRDVLISRLGLPLAKLPQGARLGTSSVRRRAQLLAYRPDFQIVNLRGNVDTRLRKAQTEEYDAIVLAAAGLTRLGHEDRITEYISPDIVLPAVGQGALAVEVREDDRRTQRIVAGLDHEPTRAAITAERAFLRHLVTHRPSAQAHQKPERQERGCQVPMAAYGIVRDGRLIVEGMVASLDGRKVIRRKVIGNPTDAEHAGEELAKRILEAGAGDILDEVRSGG